MIGDCFLWKWIKAIHKMTFLLQTITKQKLDWSFQHFQVYFSLISYVCAEGFHSKDQRWLFCLSRSKIWSECYLASCVCVPAHTFTLPPILFALFCANSFSIRPPFSLKANVWLGALIYAKLPQLPEPDHFWSMWFAIAFFLYLHRISFGICVAYLCVPTALV